MRTTAITCTIAFLALTTSTSNALVTPNQSKQPFGVASTTSSTTTATSTSTDRRNFFGVLGGAVAAVAVGGVGVQPAYAAGAIKTGPSNPFTGDYDDPAHPGCLRQVKVVGAPIKADGSRPLYAIVEVTGYDGKENGDNSKTCADRPASRGDLWKVTGKTKVSSQDQAFLDFSSKGGPADMIGKWDGSGIVFPDGNKWTKLSYAPTNRRPADMSTISDGPR